MIIIETPFGAFNVEAGVELNKDFGIRPNKWANSWASA